MTGVIESGKVLPVDPLQRPSRDILSHFLRQSISRKYRWSDPSHKMGKILKQTVGHPI